MEVTILTPLYNGIEFLEETINSVISQTYPYWKMMIGVNGHGDDGGNVGKRARELANRDGRIEVHILPSTISGKSASLNAMIMLVNTEWACMLDADDIWLSDKLQKQIDIIKANPELGVVGTQCSYFGEMTGGPTLASGHLPRGTSLSYCPMINSSTIFRTKYGRWSSSLIVNEDYDMWLHLDFCGVKMYNIPERLVRHRIHRTSAFNSKHISPDELVNEYRGLNWDIPTTTVVTSYYKLNKSKHSHAEYQQWINIFGKIPCFLVVYTDVETYDIILKARNGLESKTVIIVRPLTSFRMASPAMMELWQRHHAIDSERNIHSPELYAAWAIKQECVRETIKLDPFNSKWFVWCDIGIQRYEHLQSYYQKFPTKCIELCKPARITFLEVCDIPQSYVDDWRNGLPMRYPTPDVTLGGGCIAGDVDAWEDFGSAYEAMIYEFDRKQRFAGKDQILFFTLLMERKIRKPYHLIRATNFANISIYWMSLPCILGGSLPAIIDDRFEEEPTVSIQLEGRLGNQLFEIAAAAAHAKRNGLICSIVNNDIWYPYISHLQTMSASQPATMQMWKEPHYHYAPIEPKSCHLVGYYQSGKYFNDEADYIRSLFAPRKEMLDAMNAKYGALLDQPDCVVMHIRRGDFYSSRYRENYGIIGPTYYSNAIRRMRMHNSSGKILIFSDDPEYCRQLQLDDNVQVLEESDDVIALTLMTQFSHFILSNSSFSWWAAWLSRDAKHVLAPDKWYNPAFISDYQDVYEPTWEKIPVDEPLSS